MTDALDLVSGGVQSSMDGVLLMVKVDATINQDHLWISTAHVYRHVNNKSGHS